MSKKDVADVITDDASLVDLKFSLSEVVPPDWNTLLDADPHTDFFHTSLWAESVSHHFVGMKALFLEVRSAEKLVGGMVVFQHSSSAAGGLAVRLDSGFDGASGGPIPLGLLPPEQQDKVFLVLLDRFVSLRPTLLGVCTISLNAGHESRFGHLVKQKGSFNYQLITGAAVDLTGGSEEVSAHSMTMNKRNERNKGLRRGAEIVVSDDPQLVAEYYPIYQSASEHWGVVPMPLPFLQDLLVSGAGQVFFVAIMLEGKVIGGHLNLHQGNRVIAWNGVTDPTYARTYCPATLCMWGDIVEACRREALWLDMGASGGVVSLEGFKKYFGAVMEVRSLYVNESFLFRLLRKGRLTLQSLCQRQSESSPKNGKSQRWHDKVKPRSGTKTSEDS